MKSKKTKPQAAAPSSKGKAKIQKLRLNKETLKDLSARDAEAIKGGAPAPSRGPCPAESKALTCWC